MQQQAKPFLLKFSIDSSESLLFAGGTDKRVRIWNLKNGKSLKQFEGFQKNVGNVLMRNGMELGFDGIFFCDENLKYSKFEEKK